LTHVIGALLYSELTDRIPIVFWKENSLFYESKDEIDDETNNAFEYYYKPVSNYSIKDIVGGNYTYFNSSWTDSNILNDPGPSGNLWQQIISSALPYKLNFPGSDADVLVSTYLQWIVPLQKIIPKSNHLSALSKEELFYYFSSKYIRLRDDIKEKLMFFIKII
jgi:hypothetical protein